MTERIELRPDAEDVGKRLDQFLARRLPDISRARVQQLIAEEKVQVNGRPAKPSHKLREDEEVAITGTVQLPSLRAIPEPIPLDIVYEDNDLAVINKPAGMMVHAGAGATEDERNRGTLVNALLYRFQSLSTLGGELRPGIVHRLDRNTSGLIVVAKNDVAHRKLASQFAGREISKTYIALVHGWLQQEQGTISAAISRDVVRRTRMTVRRSEGARNAVSHYRVMRRIESVYGKFALVEVKIETGRTHQIRVHFSSIGHPVVGDTLYGAPAEIKPKGRGEPIVLNRHFLHSARLKFRQPKTNEELAFEVGLPEELTQFLQVVDGTQAGEPGSKSDRAK
jgi:23S rRNA pseudouridine1911/1915/1917 synthase